MTQEKHIFQGEQPTEAENRKEVPTAGSYIPSLVLSLLWKLTV